MILLTLKQSRTRANGPSGEDSENVFVNLEGVEQPNKSSKKNRNALSDALLMSRFQNFALDTTNKQPRNCHIFLELAQFDNFVTLLHGRKKIVYICVFSPLPAAGCGKGAAEGHGGKAVGVGVCVGGIGLLLDILGAPPGDGATYTLPYTL